MDATVVQPHGIATLTFKYQTYAGAFGVRPSQSRSLHTALPTYLDMQRQPGSPPSESAASGLHPQKDPELWFEDGNVVVVARDSAAFCVHTGVLARHSEVFRSMFEVAEPAGDIEQCPIVHMHDIPLELSSLIKALYDGVALLVPHSTLFLVC